MVYKIYRAPTYREAVLNAKMELGNDVYIIGRKDVKDGGFLGLFAKNMTEITVARNDTPIKEARSSKSGHQGVSSSPAKNEEQSALLKELQEIKSQLQGMMGQAAKVEETPFMPRLVNLLRENDFSEDYIDTLKGSFENEITLKEVNDLNLLRERFKNFILESLDISGPIRVGDRKPMVVVLVGPTGVGKTTTIAKLAASFGILQKRKVELFTIDSYRIAAIEQLGKYAELMQLPFTVINSKQEFKSALSNCKSELVFVDTAGRSQKNNLGVAELRTILDGAKIDLDIHLVISANTKYRDIVDVMTRFNQLMYKKIIVTKLDETNTIGSLLSALNKENKLSYFTTGQSVPDDIEIASKEKLFDMLILDGLSVEGY